MEPADIVANAYAMPLENPSFPPGPYRFVDREFLIITYRTSREALERVVPEPLEIVEPIVKYEFIRMPDSTGFGDYTESGQVIPVRLPDRQGGYQKGGYVHAMFLDDDPPISGGRELWGFPKKLAAPSLRVERDTLVGTLDYGSIRVATATMGYKHKPLDLEVAKNEVTVPTFMLKVMPGYSKLPRICELVRTQISNVSILGAWTGPARIQLFEHVLAPLADLPVREIVSVSHILTDLSLSPAVKIHDYLTD